MIAKSVNDLITPWANEILYGCRIFIATYILANARGVTISYPELVQKISKNYSGVRRKFQKDCHEF